MNFDQIPIVISLREISKKFTLRHENSFKERILYFKKSKFTTTEFTAINKLTLNIEAGHTIGLIGHNGSGKSTLLKIIGGIIEPTSGDVLRRGRIAALLELGAGFHSDLTGRENIFMNAAILGMSREETDKKFNEIVEFSGIGDFIDTQVKYYSSGMYVRLGFSVAVHTDPDILLVDEVLAVGDEAFQLKCLNKITEFQNDGRTIILVTHNLGQVLDLCDRAILLDHGNLVYDGKPDLAVQQFRQLMGNGPDLLPKSEKSHEKIILETQSNLVSQDHKSILLVSTLIGKITGIRNLICSVAIIDSNGVLALGQQINSFNDQSSHEEQKFTFSMDANTLKPGSYSVNVSLVDGISSKHLVDEVDLARFVVPRS